MSGRTVIGLRRDPFFMDVAKEVRTRATRQLAFTDPGEDSVAGLNVLSIVLEFDADAVLGAGRSPSVGCRGGVAQPWHADSSLRTHRTAGSEERSPVGQRKRRREQDRRLARPLQPGRSLRRPAGVRGRLPKPSRRQPRHVRSARRRHRVACRGRCAPPAHRGDPARPPGPRHHEALQRTRLPGHRAGRAHGPGARHMRWPLAQRRRHRHPVLGDRGGLGRHPGARRSGRRRRPRRAGFPLSGRAQSPPARTDAGSPV
ncbi:DUF4331 family protein [Streptomyces sp. DSM 110735]|nr:DUF4331 family protein [Streptomyces sp. DSM 110735]